MEDRPFFLKKPPLVSVVVLNYNSTKFIVSCIESVQAQSYPAVEIIVVDNASIDKSLELARTAIQGTPNSILIRNERNLGFAGGMNTGAKHASGDFIMFLNADVVLSTDYIAKAHAALQGVNQKVGMVGGRILRWVDGQRTEELDSGPIMLRKRFSHTLANDIDVQSLVFGPAGSCPLVCMEMLQDVELPNGDYYDSDYFLYFEDADLWYRAHLRGWKCLYVPDAIAWHARAASFAGKRRFYERPLAAQRWNLRNRWVTILKVLPTTLLIRLSPYLLLTELLTIGFFLLKSPRSLIALVQAAGDFIAALPETLEKRRDIQSRRTATPADLMRLFKGF